MGFARQFSRRPELPHLQGAAHGQPGIAWAARRSLIEKHGLYDPAIIDGGDELFGLVPDVLLSQKAALPENC